MYNHKMAKGGMILNKTPESVLFDYFKDIKDTTEVLKVMLLDSKYLLKEEEKERKEIVERIAELETKATEFENAIEKMRA